MSKFVVVFQGGDTRRIEADDFEMDGELIIFYMLTDNDRVVVLALPSRILHHFQEVIE